MGHLEAALRLKPDFPEAHLSMGNALIDIPGRLEDAVAEYKTAVRLSPKSDRAHSNLGNALLRAGRPPMRLLISNRLYASIPTALRHTTISETPSAGSPAVQPTPSRSIAWP